MDALPHHVVLLWLLHIASTRLATPAQQQQLAEHEVGFSLAATPYHDNTLTAPLGEVLCRFSDLYQS